jgi:hypothetical protein
MGMSLSEVAKVLAKASAFDGRKLSDAQAMAWQEVIGHLELADCLAAVTEHHSTSDTYLMPVHVRRIAEAAAARRRAIASHNRAIEAADTIDSLTATRDRSPEVDALVQALRDKLPDMTADEVFRRPEWVAADRERERASRPVSANPAYAGTPAQPPPERLCGTPGHIGVHDDHTFERDGKQWWCPGMTQAQAEAADRFAGHHGHVHGERQWCDGQPDRQLP